MKALVTGGKGFVGRAVAEALLAEGAAVRVASRSAAEGDLAGAECVAMDLTRSEDVRRAALGCDTIFHVAAMTGVWGPRRHYFAANVEGTRNVLAAALESGVRRLVYTSSPSVCFDGEDHAQVEEFEAHLAASCDEADLERSDFHAKKGDVFLWHAALVHGGAPVAVKDATRKSFVVHFSTREAYPRDRRWPDLEPTVLEINGGYLYQPPEEPKVPLWRKVKSKVGAWVRKVRSR